MKILPALILTLQLVLGGAAFTHAASNARVDVFFESMDGQGWQWFFMADAVRKRLPSVEMKVYPILTRTEKGVWEAKRGESEVAESLRVAVISKSYPDKLPVYLNGRSLSPWADGWRDGAMFAGIDPVELEKKVAESGSASMVSLHEYAKKMGVTGAAVFINGKPYNGGPRLLGLLTAVNDVLPKAQQVVIPAPVQAKATAKVAPPKFWIVLAPGVEENETIVNVFGKYFDGIKPVKLDHNSAERAKLFPDLNYAPAYILEGSKDVRTALDAEIKAGVFQDKNGYIMFLDKQRKGFYPGRSKEPGLLKVFVMSQCPFGVMAENAILDAMAKKTLPDTLKLEVHYIGDADKKDGKYEFKSLHGTPEWEENIRQLLIAKKFPQKFHAYLQERNKDVTSSQWEAAAQKAGVDPKAVSASFEEGKGLLAEDFKLASSLGVTTSPAFLWEGQTMIVGLGELAKVPGFDKVSSTATAAGGAGCSK